MKTPRVEPTRWGIFLVWSLYLILAASRIPQDSDASVVAWVFNIVACGFLGFVLIDLLKVVKFHLEKHEQAEKKDLTSST